MSDYPRPVDRRGRRMRLFHRLRRRDDGFFKQVGVAVVAGILVVAATNLAQLAWHASLAAQREHNWRLYTRAQDDKILSLSREVASMRAR